MLRIQISLDPFHFGQPDPDPFNETDQVSKKSAKFIENFHKNQPKSKEYHTFLSKILNLCLTGINIYPINIKTDHFWEKYIFGRKKVFKKLVFSRF